MEILKKPVLIYIGKRDCPGCKVFAGEWKKIKAKLAGKCKFIFFEIKPGVKIHTSMEKYSGWYPSVICAGPKSYHTIFTPGDDFTSYVGKYELKAEKFNAVLIDGKFEPAGRNNSEKEITAWFDRIKDSVLNNDEIEYPEYLLAMYPELKNS